MKRLDRFNLIDMIGRNLQDSMTTTDINVFLGGFGVDHPGASICQSKWVYVKELLANTDDDILLEIATELEIELPGRLSGSARTLSNVLSSRGLSHCQNDFEYALKEIETSPANAIGMASTTLESICKAILDEFNEPYPSDESLQSLLKPVTEKMSLSPQGHADPHIKRILGGLINAGGGLAVLRTKFSTFHGKGTTQYRLGGRHARLAVNCLSAVGLFLLETYLERFSSEKSPETKAT